MQDAASLAVVEQASTEPLVLTAMGDLEMPFVKRSIFGRAPSPNAITTIETDISEIVDQDIVQRDSDLISVENNQQVDALEADVIIEESLDSLEVDDVVAAYANADEGAAFEDEILTLERMEILEDDVSSTSKDKEPSNARSSSAEGSPKPKKMTSVSHWPKVKDMAKTFEAVASATIQKPPPPISKKTTPTKKTASTIPISSSLTRPTVASANKASPNSELPKSVNKTMIKQASTSKRPSTSIPSLSPRKSLVTPPSKSAASPVVTKASASPTTGRTSVTTSTRTSISSVPTSSVNRAVKKIIAPKVPLTPTTSARTVKVVQADDTTEVVETVVDETLIQEREIVVLETGEASAETVVAGTVVDTVTVETAIAEAVPECATETGVEKEVANTPAEVVAADVVVE
ncbi:UNVERIFIED_CONTAM: hypothetical protein HDU68_006718, partial [Siphonaria sp. JEL0065]